MTRPRIGELFAGYGGLGMGVQDVYGGDLVWYADACKFDKNGNASHHEPHRAPCSILAHHYPDVPNHGDVTTVDWSQVEPVDILTGGSPCQDLSHAGKRAGMTEGTRSNLWVAMREAIAQLRPATVIWENVRGAYSAEATSDLESDPRLLADTRRRHGEPVLRALGRVLGDLSDLGYDCRWHGLRAADIGAPHGRFRVFVIATDTQGNAGRIGNGDRSFAADPCGVRRGAGRPAGSDEATGGRSPANAPRRGLLSPDGRGLDAGSNEGDRAPRTEAHGVPALRADHGSAVAPATGAQQLLPTPRATDGTKGGPNQRGSSGDLMLPSAVAMLPTPQARDWKGYGPGDANRHDPNLSAIPLLLPTPAVNDMGEGKTVEHWDEWTAKMQAAHGNGNGHGKSLAIEAQRLLPTPTTADHKASGSAGYGGNDFCTLTDATVRQAARWGDYAEGIARWERVFVRPVPPPTMAGKKGNAQLSPVFVEWMMGLPAGWVTDVPGITRNDALKALGNGVVPQQCASALRTMLAWPEVAA